MEKERGSILLACILALSVLVGAASFIFLKKDDALPEEVAEGVIENVLSLPVGSVDLTPQSPE